MRTVKFRGKSIKDDMWVYGYYVSNDCGNHFIKQTKTSKGKITYDEIEVVPDIICEFSGQYDQNNKEIYEGDILEYKLIDSNRKFRGVVQYSARASCTVNLEYVIHFCGFYIKLIGSDDDYFEERLNEEFAEKVKYKRVEVVGNIYDNPELLEDK